MMTALLLNWRQAAGYTILAPTVEVAANAFNPARDMVRRDDDLDDLCQVQTHIRTITHRVTDTTLKVVAADPNTVSGIKSVGTLIDELWLFGKQYKAEDMLREAIGGLASRPEGFVVYTTTQSNEPPAGVFRQKLQYARDVRDGKIHDPHFLPVIFEHPPEMVESGAHLLMENLAMVNPNLGYSVDEAFLYREYRKAREAGIPDESVVGISQGWKLGGAIKTTERKLAEGVLVHGGQPLMAWCVGNARVEPKGNAILITKQASGRGKIDPLMALFNAVSLMSLNPEPKKKEYAVFFI
ncbi:terminase large subunit [Escherichia coli]|nr:terminase large subunit [Escherichia coli]